MKWTVSYAAGKQSLKLFKCSVPVTVLQVVLYFMSIYKPTILGIEQQELTRYKDLSK